MKCRRCGDAISAGGSSGTVSGSSDKTAGGDALCFFCTPTSWDAATDLSKVVGERQAKGAYEVDNERIGAIDDADWERPEPAGVDDVDIDLTTVRSSPTDYFAALDEPDDFDEKAWLEAIGSDLAEADRAKLGWDSVELASSSNAAEPSVDADANAPDAPTADSSSASSSSDPELVPSSRRRFFGRRS